MLEPDLSPATTCTGTALPALTTAVPGPRSRAAVDRLAARECPAITARRARRAAALGAADTDPIVWARARGANVQDIDGNVFVDMTAGFGVAAVGHGNPAVVAALHSQADALLHAMGDAFPDLQRIRLLERLAALTGLDRAILGSSGSDAVEAALKTARMATGRDGVLAFDRSYHGLSYGALATTGYKAGAFRAPFVAQLGTHVRHAPFGSPLGALPDLRAAGIGAVLVEPIQGRGGVQVPPAGWLAELVDWAHTQGAVVIFDEIYTGFGRTGAWFRFATEGARPDLLCVGKALTGGFPLSACVGTRAVMDAWGGSRGEALHTQTFLGNPLGCAMALAALDEVARLLPMVPSRSDLLQGLLAEAGFSTRGAGLLLGVPVANPLAAMRGLLERGFIALPAGEQAEVMALTPPLCTTPDQLRAFVAAFAAVAEPGDG